MADNSDGRDDRDEGGMSPASNVLLTDIQIRDKPSKESIISKEAIDIRAVVDDAKAEAGG